MSLIEGVLVALTWACILCVLGMICLDLVRDALGRRRR